MEALLFKLPEEAEDVLYDNFEDAFSYFKGLK
jgi:hypothetical protein